LNDELLRKVAESSAVSPEQQTVLKRLYKDQIKARGGFDAIRLAVDDAGAPFSPEQAAQIQALFDQENQSKATLTRDSQEAPDRTKVSELERDTLRKVLKLLSPAQRAALAASVKPQ
jgi:DNA-directed RNA polymerase specialized sigma24 family protein